MVRQRNNSSSPPPMLLQQHVSVIRPSSSGIQKYTALSILLLDDGRMTKTCYGSNIGGEE
jgi:hypothetical protein